jgi:hypothetical protein
VEEGSPESTSSGEALVGARVKARLPDCSRLVVDDGADHVSSSARGDPGGRPLALAGNNVSGAAASGTRGDVGGRAPRRRTREVEGRPPEPPELTFDVEAIVVSLRPGRGGGEWLLCERTRSIEGQVSSALLIARAESETRLSELPRLAFVGEANVVDASAGGEDVELRPPE